MNELLQKLNKKFYYPTWTEDDFESIDYDYRYNKYTINIATDKLEWNILYTVHNSFDNGDGAYFLGIEFFNKWLTISDGYIELDDIAIISIAEDCPDELEEQILNLVYDLFYSFIDYVREYLL